VAKTVNTDIRAWALIGAEQRLVQLAEEAAAIHQQFPELRQRSGGRGRAARSTTSDANATESTDGRRGPRRRRRTMSADARRRISEAQKARWAKQKAAGSKKR
jgi:hypothetical protein